MVKLTSSTSNYLDASDLVEAKQTTGKAMIRINGEGQLVDDTFNKGKKKLELPISIMGPNSQVVAEKTWSMNWTSQKHLIQLFGDDTAAWVGKDIEMKVSETSVGDAILPIDARVKVPKK